MKNRVLAHFVLHQGRIYEKTILEIDGAELRLSSFVQEIANTEFFSGIIALCNRLLTDEHAAELSKTLCLTDDISVQAGKVDDYLSHRDLYSSSILDMRLLFAENGRCQIKDV